MNFKVGDKVCLWAKHTSESGSNIIISEEVIVTITGTKDFPGMPKNFKGFQATDEKWGWYDKHWHVWPGIEVKRSINYIWSEHTDISVKPHKKWVPYEAVSVYNLRPKEAKILDLSGNEIKPKEAIYCKKHDQYSLVGDTCLYCSIDAKTK